MHIRSSSETRGTALVVLFVFLLVAAIAILPVFNVAEANVKGKGLIEQTRSHDPGLPNYDIRSDKGAYQKIADYRNRQSKTTAAIADIRDEIASAEESLKDRVPSLKIVYDPLSRTPEVIAPDVLQGKNVLSRATGNSRAETLRTFIAQNNSLFGVTDVQAAGLKVIADYENPEGGMSFVRLEQALNGVPVFAGEVRAGFSKDGELVRVINNLAAGVGQDVSTDFGNPELAYEIAASNIGHQIASNGRSQFSEAKDPNKVFFGKGDFAPMAEKIYFPTEPGVIVPAWRVLIWQPVNAFYLIVDAETGTVLWRKNITEDQTQPVSYNIWANPNAMINVADNPFPMTPGPNSPNGVQGAALARSLVTLVGNEPPYTFNNNGWINDGVNITDGNAAEAGLDRDGAGTQPSNGVDANGIPTGSAFRVFDYPINPGIPTNPALNQGDSPLQAGVNPTPCFAAGTSPAMIDFQRAAVTTLFYITNRYHDELYRLGFTEGAGNFQHDNFGRGGSAGDRVSAEAQDCSGTNNANFGTASDGIRGRMQMYLWSAPTPDFDGDLDADVIIHELTHGLSNRLHGNASGLAGNMARGMGEGWSDFYGHAMLSEPADSLSGIYTTGAYDTYMLRTPSNTFNNYYYGIRRFPKAIRSSTGGPLNRPHNPLTFADIDATQANLSDGAFAPVNTGSSNDAVHAAGEVWSSMLWEVRAKYIARLGWETGNRRILQHVTDGMKLAPLNPTFVDSRNAIVAAALASGTDADARDIWEGFAIRGLGASAVVLNPGSGGGSARVTEAFDLPNLQLLPLVVTDVGGVGNGNGFPEPGETIRVTVPLRNITGNAASDVNASIVGGGNAAYGSIAHNGDASNVISYTVPAATGCGSVLNITINVNSSLGPVSFVRPIRIGIPTTSLTENFDGVTAPGFPAGWTVATELGGIAFVTSAAGADTPPNSAFALDPLTVGGGTSITSPSIAIQSAASTVSFRNRWDTEPGWDGGVLEISVNGAAFQDIIAAGGTWVSNGYNATLGSNGTNNPLNGRTAWTGNSGGYVSTVAIVPPSAVGQNVQFRWRFGADDNTAATGWNVDDVRVIGNYTCSFTADDEDVRSDFDGDGITDIALFRPSEGIWYVLASTTGGYFGFNWGLNGDVPAPADYDDDGKTDAGIYRPGGGSNSIFYVLKSSDFTYSATLWGLQGDIPVVRDYDGDDLPDIAVYRPSENNWYVLEADGGFQGVNFGVAGDIPVAGDFDGDGIGDMTVFRNGDWITRRSTGGTTSTNWGLSSDRLVPADYDDDGKDDYAVFRPADGVWWVLKSSTGGFDATRWGLNGDIPAPGDYDGDGRADPAIFRGGEWWMLFSSGGHGSVPFGLPGDLPVAAGYIP